MITLKASNIYLNQPASDKEAALNLVGEKLVVSGLTSEAYINGLKKRENISSTYLGNGIAIPHGTLDTRSAVLETGVAVVQFPNGVDWGNGDIVYLAVGIAAQSDEHLQILSGLSRVLDNEALCQQLANTKNTDLIIAAIEGRSEVKPVLSEEIIRCNYAAESLQDIKEMTAAALGVNGYITEPGAEAMAESIPVFIGQHIALISTADAAHTGIALITSKTPIIEQGREVKVVIAISANNNQYLPFIRNISQWEKEPDLLKKLSTIVPATLLEAVSGKSFPDSSQMSVIKTFVIKNEHGIHARPGSAFVASIKPFEAKVEVRNLSKNGAFVNARSLVKILGLGVSKNSEIEVRATGIDSSEALDALKQAITQGLGE